MEKIQPKSLNNEIFIIQLEEHTTNFDNRMKKEFKKDLKSFLYALIPLGIGSIISLIIFNPIPFSVGLTMFGLGAIVKRIKDDIDHDQEFNRYLSSIAKKDKSVVYMNGTEPLDVLVSKKIVEKKDSDYYSSAFKDFLKQKQEDPTPEIKLSEEKVILDKDATMEQLVYEYECYRDCYNLPELAISSKEWDLLFGTIFSRLEELDLTDSFYDIMSIVQRYALSYCLLHNAPTIEIYSYLNSLNILSSYGFSESDINSIRAEIDKKINTPDKKVIAFNPNQLKKSLSSKKTN